MVVRRRASGVGPEQVTARVLHTKWRQVLGGQETLTGISACCGRVAPRSAQERECPSVYTEYEGGRVKIRQDKIP